MSSKPPPPKQQQQSPPVYVPKVNKQAEPSSTTSTSTTSTTSTSTTSTTTSQPAITSTTPVQNGDVASGSSTTSTTSTSSTSATPAATATTKKEKKPQPPREHRERPKKPQQPDQQPQQQQPEAAVGGAGGPPEQPVAKGAAQSKPAARQPKAPREPRQPKEQKDAVQKKDGEQKQPPAPKEPRQPREPKDQPAGSKEPKGAPREPRPPKEPRAKAPPKQPAAAAAGGAPQQPAGGANKGVNQPKQGGGKTPNTGKGGAATGTAGGKKAAPAQAKNPKEEQERREQEAKRKEEEQRIAAERLKEEERKKEEERLEALRREEEERRLEQERLEKERLVQEQQARERLAKLKEELLVLSQLRANNTKANAKSRAAAEEELHNLDSGFKRITNFLKKLKSISDVDHKENLLTEIQQLNLSKYTTEIIPSIVKSSFKNNDVPIIVRLLCVLHQRYDGIDSAATESLFQLFEPLPIMPSESEAERNAKITKRRNAIRLIVELYCVDILHGYAPISKLINKMITGSSYEPERDCGYPVMHIFISFLRACAPLIGYSKDKCPDLPDFYNNILTTEEQTSTRELAETYYKTAIDYLQREQQTLREKEKEIKSAKLTKGEVSEQIASSYEALRKNYEKLTTVISSFAEIIGETVPSSDYSTKMETEANESKDQLELFDSPWENDEQRHFYDNLVALPIPKAKVQQQQAATAAAASGGDSATTTTTTATSPSTPVPATTSTPTPTKKHTKDPEEKAAKAKANQIYKECLQQLRTATLKPSIVDNIVLDFVKINIKASKKKDFIADLSQCRADQIPFYCRFIASLNQSAQHKEFVSNICQSVEDELTGLIEKKEQVHLTIQIKNVKIIGELVKFRVLPNPVAFNYLKLCFDDFTHHNIDIACTLLEVCGRYLYKLPETQFRLKNMLDILIRNKNAKVMEPRHEGLIDNAYLSCRPMQVKKKVVDPVRQFTKWLIFKYLCEETTKKVVDKLLQLPWPQCQPYLKKYLLAVHKGKFGNIYPVADILYALRRYYPTFVRHVIWQLIEDITSGFERNDFTRNQKRIMAVTLFGELYNACLLNSFHVFALLKGALEYGYSTMHLLPVNPDREKEFLKQRYKPNINDFDPINDTFRIRFICSLILVCKDCFSDKDITSHLQPYLLFLQRYALTKQLSLELEFMLSECLAIVPKIKVFKTWEEANEECSKNASKLQFPTEEEMMQQQQQQQSAENDNDLAVGGMGGGATSSAGGVGHTRRKDLNRHNDAANDTQRQETNHRSAVDIKRRTQEETEEDMALLMEFKRAMQESTEARKSDRPNVGKLVLPSVQLAAKSVTFPATSPPLLSNETIPSTSGTSPLPSTVTTAPTSPPPVTQQLSPQPTQQLQLPQIPTTTTTTQSNGGGDQPERVQFKLLLKRGNKPIQKNIEISEDFSFVAQIKQAQEEEERNVQENKRNVLRLASQNT
ncbi:hypothetical protein SAMD00019534_069340 [Acytostelium subglobosum LB1]|uniref:hypothetical protein n=1 Tax=Acytostelium subglobosum LB1 TaxID=1410327 RepID=UPI000644E12E|nr:hypothetical protein SAMD00019534_069340 [Acytostelium subglobosum LB1]GAM23759.1 hypothetical protein SAMD00019534_069340 [Acytostelium subglobosum LB1]|eukprot:XP_012753500.1 hypothetical protein SAMD00019534_069340 [Acytostelium subglobosum LB1]